MTTDHDDQSISPPSLPAWAAVDIDTPIVDPLRVRHVAVDAAELLSEAARLITVAIASEPRNPADAEIAFRAWIKDGETWLRRFRRDVAR